jgi:hypothetical protein
MYTQLQEYLENETLLYITYVVKKIGRRTVWGRVLQVIESEEKILIYDVDNKTVEQINLHQIDEINV